MHLMSISPLNMKRRNSVTIPLVLAVLYCTAASAQLTVTVSPVKVVGQKAVVPLALKNGFADKIESARCAVFLLDAEGKVVGQAARWIIGGGTNRAPLAVGATNSFQFVVPTGGKPFVTNRFTITQINLANGKTANPVSDVQILSGHSTVSMSWSSSKH